MNVFKMSTPLSFIAGSANRPGKVSTTPSPPRGGVLGELGELWQEPREFELPWHVGGELLLAFEAAPPPPNLRNPSSPAAWPAPAQPRSATLGGSRRPAAEGGSGNPNTSLETFQPAILNSRSAISRRQNPPLGVRDPQSATVTADDRTS